LGNNCGRYYNGQEAWWCPFGPSNPIRIRCYVGSSPIC
jgi:hypothetical protein